MHSGSTSAGVTSPIRDFSTGNTDSMFGQQACFCGCCNLHQSTNQSNNKALNSGMSSAVNSGKPSQVLTFPDSKSPISSFNESRRINITASSAASWKADFQCPTYPSYKSNEGKQQSMSQIPQQHCCCPPMLNGGSVEVVKIGEGPPLTWADLQRHGGFSFPDADDWPAPIQTQRPAPIQQSSQIQPQKCASRKIFIPQDSKRTPISDYNNWSQRKKAPHQAMDIPGDLMNQQPLPSQPSAPPKTMGPGSGCFCDQSKLMTTTAQTEAPVSCHHQHQQQQQHHFHPMMIPQHCAHSQCTCGGQNFNVEPWQPGSTDVNVGLPMRPVGEVQQKKYSLPPASHHSPEQRTSYRVKRLY